MKRFINLGSQLYLTSDAEDKAFSFYCTVTDSFETHSCIQTFSSIEEFKECYEGNDLKRYLALIPKDWKEKDIE